MIIIIFAYMEPITGKGLELRTEDILSRLSEESLHYLFPGYDSRSGVPVPEGTMEEEEEEDSTTMFQIQPDVPLTAKRERKEVSWKKVVNKFESGIGSIFDLTVGDFYEDIEPKEKKKKPAEGISFKNLIDHRKELESIYMRMTGRSDIEAVRRSIDDLVNPILHNSINEKVSRIKRAFLNAVDEKVAKYYYIDGEKGEVRKIAIDRSMVVFW